MKTTIPTGLPYSPEDHGPVLYAPRLLGCSCGFVPSKPTPSLGNVHAGYKAHRRKAIGESNDWRRQPAVFGYGPDLGQRTGTEG